jgi:hypothetical protein
MSIAGEHDNFGQRVAESLGLDPRTVVGIDIRIEPGNLIIATAKIFVRENQIEGLGVIFDEMKFVGIKKGDDA